MKKVLLTCALTAGITSSGFAVIAQSGVYLNINGGYSFPVTWSDSSFAPASVTQSNRGVTGGAALGYDYALDQNYLIGLEGGYTYFGKTDYNFANSGTLTTKEEGIQALLTGTYLNQSGFNIFGKAGAVYMDETAYFSGLPTNPPESNIHAWEPALAAGIGYMPIQNLNVALQYEHIFGSTNRNVTNTITKPQAQNAVTLGLTYKFGNAAF